LQRETHSRLVNLVLLDEGFFALFLNKLMNMTIFYADGDLPGPDALEDADCCTSFLAEQEKGKTHWEPQ
jgi:hypothetical protein